MNRSLRNREDEWQEEASFVNSIYLGRQADFAARRLHRVTPIFVSGRLRSHERRDEEDIPRSYLGV